MINEVKKGIGKPVKVSFNSAIIYYIKIKIT